MERSHCLLSARLGRGLVFDRKIARTGHRVRTFGSNDLLLCGSRNRIQGLGSPRPLEEK